MNKQTPKISHYPNNHYDDALCGVKIHRALFSSAKIEPHTHKLELVTCTKCMQKILKLTAHYRNEINKWN